jgi:uncharacterized protein (DUF736 family)
MLNGVGYVIKQTDRRYTAQLRVISVKAESDTLSDMRNSADSQPDFCIATKPMRSAQFGLAKSETSNKEYVSLSIAAPEFGPKKPFANLHSAAGSDEESVFTAIRNTGD